VKDGLAHNSVNDIIEDSSGALWIATGFGGSGGANIIEDDQWSTLTKEDGLAGEKVRSLYEDRDGNLWLGSEYDGVAINVKGAWKAITPEDGLAGWEILEIIQDKSGVLWVATENGVSRITSVDFLFAGE
jgi:ligand-binding sensor domain-containing protein